MMRYLLQLWRSPDLRRRILFTMAMLFLYRVVSHIPIPSSDPLLLADFLKTRGGAAGALGVFTALTGGALDNFSVVLLGLSPYINASIIIQLCTVIFPQLESIKKEGVQGQQTLNRYTRWLALPLAFLQSYGFLILLNQGAMQGILDTSFPAVLFPMLVVTAGSIFIMWLGEIITEKGIGNGISMIIFAGIISGIPSTLTIMLANDSKLSAFYLFIIVSLAMLVAIVLFTDAHRVIPLTYANQGAGRGVQGTLPIRLNQAGMIPIIFAVSLITFPAIVAQLLQNAPRFAGVIEFINRHLNANNPSLLYMVLYFLLVLVFTYFYVSVTFQPDDVAESIQKRGGFIPGVRPGKQTAEVLARVSNRLNLWGGTFLGVVAIIPLLFTSFGGLSSQDLIISGSGLIIVVGVVMELIRQINAQLLAHDYEKLT